jgi:capsular polysaccharide export protein
LSQIRAEIIGIKPWKRWQIDCFLRPRYGVLHYAGSAAEALRNQARHGGVVVVWAAREPADFAKAAAAQGAHVVRIEDGFLRSVGLGSNHFGGASLVIDEDGIYFDPRNPSRLERLLQAGDFGDTLLGRAARLRETLVRCGLTKYNVGTTSLFTVPKGDRPRLLVPGQVEDDASVRFGACDVRTNLQLLQRVREAHPDAWIVYKPHPDTEAGTRKGRVPDADALRHANQIARGISPVTLFPQIDAVHTMTSLLGFEALLRGVPVTVWGQPFYSGWGLTCDQLPHARRQRRLTLDELVAGALIAYPDYVHPQTLQPCAVEEVAEILAGSHSAEPSTQSGSAQRIARMCQGLYRSWVSARRLHQSG